MKITRDGRRLTISGYSPSDCADPSFDATSTIKGCPEISVDLAYVGDSNAGKAIILDNIVLPAIVDALRVLHGDDMPDAETLG